MNAWPRRHQHGERSGEGHPEGDCDHDQAKADQDREAADDDDRERQGEPPRHRPPPEVERLCVLRPEQQEAEDEAEVRRVEDVRAAELDHVLREERDRGRAGEDRTSRSCSTSRRARSRGRAGRRRRRCRSASRSPATSARAGGRRRSRPRGRAQVPIAIRIWAIDSRKSNATWPRTWSEMITAARWSRGSLSLGSRTGYGRPRIVRARPAGAASAGALMGCSWYSGSPCLVRPGCRAFPQPVPGTEGVTRREHSFHRRTGAVAVRIGS